MFEQPLPEHTQPEHTQPEHTQPEHTQPETPVQPSAPRQYEITPWEDPVIDARGYDPRSSYVEQFWLAVLGPSSVWFLRHVAERFEREPTGFTLDVAECSAALGLGTGLGRHAPFTRTVTRCCQFSAATRFGAGGLAVRKKLPPLARSHALRLPELVQQRLAAWQEWELAVDSSHRGLLKARRLGLSLIQAGEDFDGALRQLLTWGLHPAVAQPGVEWAWARSAELSLDDAA